MNNNVKNPKNAFDVKTSFTIFSLFNMRYELHKNFYNHKTIILLEAMATDAIMSVFSDIGFREMFKDDSWLYELTDDLLLKLLKFKTSKPIIEKILLRKLYKIAPKNYKGDVIKVSKHIGLTGKKINPLLNINCYDKKDEYKIKKLDMNDFSIFKLFDSYEIETFNIIRT